MRIEISQRMGLKGRLLLGVVLIVHCLASNAQDTQKPAFDVASVKEAPPGADAQKGTWSLPGIGAFHANNISVSVLIQLAYDVDASQILNKPDWLDTAAYSIDAKPEAGIKLTRDELRPRLQDLLVDRFHLRVHEETQRVRGFALVISKEGAHLKSTVQPDFPGDFLNVSPGHMSGYHWTMPQLAKFLTRPAGFPVVDQSGINGKYDIDFRYNPHPEAESTYPEADNTYPILSDALKASTGLILKPAKVPVGVIVIDSVSKTPTAN